MINKGEELSSSPLLLGVTPSRLVISYDVG